MNTPIKTATPALDKVMLIIDFIAHNGPQTFSSIYQNLNLPKSSTSTLLGSMLAHKILRQNNDKYDLGLRLYEIGTHAFAHFDIKEYALPILKKLRDDSGLTCHLGVLEGNNPVYLLKVESSYAVIVNSWIGKRLPINSTALGKIFLAFSDENKALELIENQLPLQKYTEKTIIAPDELMQQRAQVKNQGFAIDNQEDVTGIVCLAAPIFDSNQKLIAAISMSGVLAQYEKSSIEHMVNLLKEAATQISDKAIA